MSAFMDRHFRYLKAGQKEYTEAEVRVIIDGAIQAERQRIHDYLMRLHLDAGGKHNYLHVAANGLEDL